MNLRIILALAAAVLLAPSASKGGSIGLYADSACTRCDLRIEAGHTATLYIRASTENPPPGLPAEVRSGQFRVVGLPARWMATTQPDPAPGAYLTTVGDPFGDGVVFAFGSCASSACLPLFRVTLTATSNVQDALLQVVRAANPAPPFGFPLDCPWMHFPCGGCDAPCDNGGSCVDGAGLVLNATASCMVGVAPSTWSRLKQLYD